MDGSRISAALLSQVNDVVVVRPYGHGHLVTMPLTFYDSDRVTLFVERYEGGVRVTDHGTTAMRLHMADVNVDTQRIQDIWRRSIASLGQYSLTVEEGEVAAWGEESDVGRLLLAVAEACLRVDQIRWMTMEHRPVKFVDRVVQQVIDAAGSTEKVTARAGLRQKSGRVRQVTAAVGNDDNDRIYIQAVGSSDRERAVEHCFYVFNHAELPRARLLAVAAGNEDQWDPQLIGELDSVTDVVFFDQSVQVRNLLRRRLASVM